MKNEEAINKALLTWYPRDHNLHFNPHYPLGKLCSGWGKLLDDYMKFLYKPDYKFEPIGKLNDIWYYLCILCYQQAYKPRYTVDYIGESIDQIIVQCVIISGEVFCNLSLEPISYTINAQYSALIQIGRRHNLSLQQITDSKWCETRVQTDYVNVGKIGKLS